jgi:hypothetical protein
MTHPTRCGLKCRIGYRIARLQIIRMFQGPFLHDMRESMERIPIVINRMPP